MAQRYIDSPVAREQRRREWNIINQLRLSVRCPDCGAPAHIECYPEFGCDSIERAEAALEVFIGSTESTSSTSSVEPFGQEEIKTAIRKVMDICDARMKDYKGLSMRDGLRLIEPALTIEQINAVIQYCADHGFDYCVDPMIASSSYPDFVPEKPNYWACVWGPDQLKSRLHCVI